MKFTALLLTLLASVEAADKLQIGVLKKVPDCTRKARAGDFVSVHYVGRLEDGKEFDNSVKRGKPIEFGLGSHQVIEGWDQGILGMCLGEKRKLTIPPHLGYGDRATGPIPAGATLIFETELVGLNGKYLAAETEETEETEETKEEL